MVSMSPLLPRILSLFAITTQLMAGKKQLLLVHEDGSFTLAEVRKLLNEAKRMVVERKPLVKKKIRANAQIKDTKIFGIWAQEWLCVYQRRLYPGYDIYRYMPEK